MKYETYLKKHGVIHPVIEGYYPRRYMGGGRYERVVASLISHREYWAVWRKKQSVKLRKTRWHPTYRDYGTSYGHSPVCVGCVDYYGWTCIQLLEVVTCVELDRVHVQHQKK